MPRLPLLRYYLTIGGSVIIVIGGICLAVASQIFISHTNIPGNKTVIPPKDFVTRSGSQLFLSGKPFRFAGANMYWLGLDENVGGTNYPTHFRVDDAFAAAEEMGATVVRAQTLGISVGCSLCVEPSLGQFSETALEHIDYAIQSARGHHLHLIIPLVDNWHYYLGGKHTFTDWRGIADENRFYTDPTVIHDFEQYINVLLNHVNVYTGIAYKDDSTILAWETGSELTAPTTWTKTLADYLHSLDSKHLIIDGSTALDTNALSLTNIDIYTAHYYPASIALLQDDAARARAAKKVFYIGEYTWRSGDPLGNFLTAIEKSGAAGDTYWSFFPHNDTSGYVQHTDGYTLHYPGDNSAMRTAVQLLRTHAYRMQGRAAPSVGIPDAPLITSVGFQTISWRGTALGDSYTIERSTTGANGPWTVLCDRCVTDNASPWSDVTQPTGTLWYRMQAYNIAGVAGPYSIVYPLWRGQ